MNFLKKIFHRRREKKLSIINYPLSIDGVAPAPLTAEPDESELAAAALLESLVSPARMDNSKRKNNSQLSIVNSQSRKGSPAYYRQLSEKIKAAHEQERRAAMRYVAYCEAQIRKGNGLSGTNGYGESKAAANSSLFTLHSSLQDLERGLFKHQDTVKREGGELFRRWQHCLAEVTLRQMKSETPPDLNGLYTPFGSPVIGGQKPEGGESKE